MTPHVRDRIRAAHERVIAARRQLEATLPADLDPLTRGILSAVDSTLADCERSLWDTVARLESGEHLSPAEPR